MKKGFACGLLGVLFLIFQGGCQVAGGGGSCHRPPDSIRAGEPTSLQLEMHAYNVAKMPITKRFTEVTLHYRLSNDKTYSSISMKLIGNSSKSVTYEACLPPIAPSEHEYVEYYFDFYFDGVHNGDRSESKTVSVSSS